MPIDLAYPEHTYKDEGINVKEGARPEMLDLIGGGAFKTVMDVAGAATIIGGGVTRALNEPEGDKWFKFYDEKIAPARRAFTPDPESIGTAGKIVHGISSLLPYLFTGPAAPALIMGSQGIMQGADLVEQGVDAKTATLGAVGTATLTGAQVFLPMAGRTLPKTAGMVGAGTAIGAAERAGMRELLQHGGYWNLAENYNPFAADALAIDTVMGGLFGILGHAQMKGQQRAFDAKKEGAATALETMTIPGTSYHNWLKTLPVELEDAVALVRDYQKRIKSLPFDPKQPGAINAHFDALNKAIEDLSMGRPVDVSGVVNRFYEPLNVGIGAATPKLNAYSQFMRKWLDVQPAEYFAAKGYTAEQARAALLKQDAGQKLTIKEKNIADDIVDSSLPDYQAKNAPKMRDSRIDPAMEELATLRTIAEKYPDSLVKVGDKYERASDVVASQKAALEAYETKKLEPLPEVVEARKMVTSQMKPIDNLIRVDFTPRPKQVESIRVTKEQIIPLSEKSAPPDASAKGAGDGENSGTSSPAYLKDSPELEATGEAILANKPDVTFFAGREVDGSDVAVSAKSVIERTKADIDRTTKMKELFRQAAACLWMR